MSLLELKTIHDRCEEVGECLVWADYCSPSGLPMFSYRGHPEPVPRVVFCESRGIELSSIAGLVVWAKCQTRSCCHEDHLICGSRGAWWAWRKARGLTAKTPSEIAATTKATRAACKSGMNMEKARAIRAEKGRRRQKDTAADHGITQTMVSQIQLNRAWRESIANSSVFNMAA